MLCTTHQRHRRQRFDKIIISMKQFKISLKMPFTVVCQTIEKSIENYQEFISSFFVNEDWNYAVHILTSCKSHKFWKRASSRSDHILECGFNSLWSFSLLHCSRLDEFNLFTLNWKSRRSSFKQHDVQIIPSI